MRRTAAVVSIVLMSALGACGGSDSSSTGGSGPGSSSSGDGGGDKDVPLLDPCKAITADEVGGVIKATVTSEVGPFDACEYDQEDPRATSVAIDAQSLSEMGGGFAAFKSGTAATLTGGETVDVPGVGDQAFIVTGTFGAGENTQLQGATSVGDQLITVNLTQASGLAADVLVAQAKELLTLAASKV